HAFCRIGPLAPSHGRDMLLDLEAQRRRRLQESQRDYLIARYENAGCSPLYLRTAFEIAAGWKSHQVPGSGRHVLAADTAGIIAEFLAELSSVHHHEPALVRRALGYLAAAKDGLSARELTELLSGDGEVMGALSSERHGVLTDRLPPSAWVRLNRDLAAFL